jgi:hypothetical protein
METARRVHRPSCDGARLAASGKAGQEKSKTGLLAPGFLVSLFRNFRVFSGLFPLEFYVFMRKPGVPKAVEARLKG